MADIFHNATKKLPTSDGQIVRVSMESSDIGGRKSHLPASGKSSDMSIAHTGSK